jgi:superfamily II DNA or RNA helicase
MVLPLFDASTDEEPDVELSAPGLDDRNEERRWLDRILQLARLAEVAESKLAAISRLLRRAAEPAIVFTEYRDTLARMALALQELAPATLHGGLTPLERRESLRRFTSGGARLLLATDAASEGLNLHQRCRLVINLELPWTPLRLEQRIGRVERIGQSRRVHAIHLVAAGTAEESYEARLKARGSQAVTGVEQLREGPPQLQLIRSTAEAEAVRLATHRALAESADDVLVGGRPPVTILRRRGGTREDVWAFHIVFADSCNQPVWSTLLGATTSSSASAVLPHSVNETATALATVIEHDRRQAAAALAASLRACMDLASRREAALIDSLETQRARLSATLLQGGLFDRQAERAFASQSAVLEEALSQCQHRANEIHSATRIISEPARLAFVLVRR